MLLIRIVLEYLFRKIVFIISCLFSFSFYKRVFQNLLIFIYKLASLAKDFIIFNENFYLIPSDRNAFTCLCFSAISLINIFIIILFFYASCPIFLSYFTKVIYFFICGVTVKFKFKFHEVNTYLIVLLSYIFLFLILLALFIFIFLYLIIFFYIFYYNTFRFFLIVFRLF